MMFQKTFNKKRGLLTLEHIDEERSIVIESNFEQYVGTTTHTKIDTTKECTLYFNERVHELNPPKPRKDNKQRI